MHLPADSAHKGTPSQSTQSNIPSGSSETLVLAEEATGDRMTTAGDRAAVAGDRVMGEDRATARVAPTIDEATDKLPAVSAPSGGKTTVAGDRAMGEDRAIDEATDSLSPVAASSGKGGRASWVKWYEALKSILPIYIGIHLAFFVTSFLSVLFVLSDFSKQSMPIYTLWQSWHHWDTGNFLVVAVHGYTAPNQTAFFPLYPIFERGLMFITNNPFTAGLIISDVAGLVMLVVLYRLVEEDFDAERAYRTVLYLSVFPTAFFLAAAYNESLFICFALFSFYYMRHGNWWLAGLFGFLATLTRSSGLFLLVPFCYEYLRQQHFNLRTIRFDIISGLAMPAAIGAFALYCYFQFHDALASLHAQAYWHPRMHIPGEGMILSLRLITHSGGLLNFQAIHNLLDLVPDLLVLGLIILSFVGPWKLPRNLWAYGLYAAALYLFFQLYPTTGIFPLLSVARYLLEVFPAFIILASLGKNRTIHMSYLMVSGATLFFLLAQFLIGRWVL